MATWLWLRSEWRRSWSGLVGLTLVVALVLGATLALWFGARRADSATDRFSAAVGLPNLAVQALLERPDPELLDGFARSVALLPQAAALPGVTNALAEAWWAVIPADGVVPGQPVTPFVIGFSAAEDTLPLMVVDGSLDLDDPDAIVVNEAMARQGIGVGSTIPLRTVATSDLPVWAENDATLTDESGLTGPTIDAHVSAVVRVADDLSGGDFPTLALLPGFSAAHGADVAHVEQSAQVRVEAGREEAVRSALEELYGPFNMVPAPLDDPLEAVRQAVAVEVRTLQIGAVVVALAGLLLLAQVLARVSTRAATAHPARRALGATSADLAAGTLVLVLPALLAGAAVGVGVAIAASSRFPIGQAGLVEPHRGVQVEPLALLATTVALLAVVAALAAASAHRTARSRERRPGRPIAVRLAGRPAALLGASFALDPMADARRSRATGPATVLSIAVAVAGMVTVSMFVSSLASVREHPALSGAPGSYVRDSNGAFGADDAVAIALGRDDVTSVTQLRLLDENGLQTEIAGTQVVPMAFDSLKGSGLPAVTSGRLPSSPDEVALGPRTAEQLGAGVGDIVEVEDVTGTVVPLTVVGTVIAWSADSFGDAFVVTTDRLQQSACGGEPLQTCNLVVLLFADPAGAEAERALEQVGFAPTFSPPSVERMDQVGRIPWVLAIFLAVLAVVAVANLLVATLRRRRRDLAVARVFGMTARRCGDPTVWQAGIIAVVGAGFGTVLGIVAGRILWRILADDLMVLYHPVVGRGVVVGVAVAAVALTLLVSAAPAAWTTRLKPGKVLRAE